MAPLVKMELQMIGEQMYHTILSLRKCGVSQREIASELSISKTTVNKYCTMTQEDEEFHSCQRAGRSESAIAEEFIRDRLIQKLRLRTSRLYDKLSDDIIISRASREHLTRQLDKIEVEVITVKPETGLILKTCSNTEISV